MTVQALKLLRENASDVPAIHTDQRPAGSVGHGHWRSFRSSVFFDEEVRQNRPARLLALRKNRPARHRTAKNQISSENTDDLSTADETDQNHGNDEIGSSDDEEQDRLNLSLSSDSDGSVCTELSEDEDTGHQVLTGKDWTETVKFLQLMCLSKWVIEGFVVPMSSRATSCDVHKKGFYAVTANPGASSPSKQCLLHSLRKKATIVAVKRRTTKCDQIRAAQFHPLNPWLCIAYTKSVKVFSLQSSRPDDESGPTRKAGQLVKRFKGGRQMDRLEVHPNGEHLIRACANGRVHWYDFEYASTPYKILEVSDGTMTAVKHHPTLPILAVGCSQGHIQLLHPDVENGLFGEAKITPLVKLSDKVSHVTSLTWHPKHHWLAAGYSNGKVAMWI